MGYLDFIISRKKKTQTETPFAPAALLDLPGFSRRDGIIADDMKRKKMLYNDYLKNLRLLTRSVSSAKGEKKKEEQAMIAELKDTMEYHLSRIGPCTSEERMNGFDEVKCGF